MVVLHVYGTIDQPICISNKLKLFISNLPNDENDNWKKELVEELQYMETINNLYCTRSGVSAESRLTKLFKKICPQSAIPDSASAMAEAVADKMTCLYFNYEYNDMPLGGWETNCFDGRSCEEEYAEKIIDLMTFLSYRAEGALFPAPVQWVYSSSHDEIDCFRIFWGGNEATTYIDELKKWGQLFDAFLVNQNDYYLFNYLCNSIHKDNDHNTYHLLKSYSLCQLFLEKEREQELDDKLPYFLDTEYSDEERREMAKLLRQIRNKIAHGDYVRYEQKIEEYASNYMDGRFEYDYSEFSRQNWALSHLCCTVDDALRKIIYLLFTNRDSLESIKNGTVDERGNQ